MEKQEHMVAYIPQWQGGGQDLGTYEGAASLRRLYLDPAGVEPTVFPVRTSPISPTEHDIMAYADILAQQTQAHAILAECDPSTIFTVGGGCDADLPCIAHLASKYDDLTLLYLDAHGDLNAPEESASRFFYGMPVRTALGEGDPAMIEALPATLSPSHLVMGALRNLDPSEWNFIHAHKVAWRSVDEIEKVPEALVQDVRNTGARRLYVHIDVDSLEPNDFPYISVPEPGGFRPKTMLDLLKVLDEEFELVGLGFLEYYAADERHNELVQGIFDLGLSLGRERG